MRPLNPKGYHLLHEGVKALSVVEGNGMRVDLKYLRKADETAGKKIRELKQELREQDEYKLWRRRFGANTSLGSRDQLCAVLQRDLGIKMDAVTEKGKAKMDEAVLERINLPFVAMFLKLEKHNKIKGTYLSQIKNEVCGEFIHPFFNLHIPVTYRSSSDSPNFQNFPIRIPEYAKIIRSCFIPRKGNRLLELDFGGIEVMIAACYHKDPVMMDYLRDDTKDMHRDTAADCFILKPGQVSKNVRYCGKNMFVFPQFYGDYFANNAKALWDAVKRMDLKTTEGVDLKQHLKAKGIRKLGKIDPDTRQPTEGSFMAHIKEVERIFWEDRFSVYSDWKERWWKSYLKNGYFDTLTNFRLSGIYSRNQAINYPVQGSAFHCLLWCLIRLIKLIRKYKMKTKIVGQIHDSIVADSPEAEYKEFIALAHKVMTVDILEYWKWIILQLKIEAEVAPLGKSWFYKEEYQI